jgi:hypothetical protein
METEPVSCALKDIQHLYVEPEEMPAYSILFRRGGRKLKRRQQQLQLLDETVNPHFQNTSPQVMQTPTEAPQAESSGEDFGDTFSGLTVNDVQPPTQEDNSKINHGDVFIDHDGSLNIGSCSGKFTRVHMHGGRWISVCQKHAPIGSVLAQTAVEQMGIFRTVPDYARLNILSHRVNDSVVHRTAEFLGNIKARVSRRSVRQRNKVRFKNDGGSGSLGVDMSKIDLSNGGTATGGDWSGENLII